MKTSDHRIPVMLRRVAVSVNITLRLILLADERGREG